VQVLEKSVTETLAMNRQAFGEESITTNGKSKHTKTKKGETDEEQSQSMIIISFDFKGIVQTCRQF
jgi:hypothetical protein